MGTSAPSTVSFDPRVDSAVTLRVVVIDHRHDRRQLMRQVVQLGGDDVEVVGFAEDAATAVETVGRLEATAVILEIQLPLAVGLETIAALHEAYPTLRIVVCTFHRDEATQLEALARGATAYLIKPLSPRDIYPKLTA